MKSIPFEFLMIGLVAFVAVVALIIMFAKPEWPKETKIGGAIGTEEPITCEGSECPADLGYYPEMFIESGNFNGVIVIGDYSDPEDTIAATNIASSLQYIIKNYNEKTEGTLVNDDTLTLILNNINYEIKLISVCGDCDPLSVQIEINGETLGPLTAGEYTQYGEIYINIESISHSEENGISQNVVQFYLTEYNNKIEVGAVKLASEVDDIKNVNAIVIGSPCVNYASSQLLGLPEDCTQDSHMGVAQIRLFNYNNLKQILVAGYSSEDDLTASEVLANYNEYNLEGSLAYVYKENDIIKVGYNIGCTDSDIGRDYDNKGFVDYFIDDVKINTYGDNCNWEWSYLREFYCENNVINEDYIYCEFGCNNGACLKEEDVVCTDSDGGRVYDKKGTTEIIANNQLFVSRTDECPYPSYVVEYYCNNKNYDYESKLCEYGCYDGVCLDEENKLECIESDAGIDYYVKGTFTLKASDSIIKTNTDFCLSNNLYEYSCDFDYYSKIIICEEGCQDGACLGAECLNDSDCNDNITATNDKCIDHKCKNTIVTSCTSGDRYCPANCTNQNDNDCPASDQCSSNSDCNDNDKSTTDICSGTPKRCRHYEITDCTNGDNYCPSNCNKNNDNDCKQCSSNSDCNDNDPLTRDSCEGSQCRHFRVSNCISGDNYCPSECNQNTDPDCTSYECSEDSGCNDNDVSTYDRCISRKCVHEKIATCISGDSYCPSSCTYANDKDCSCANDADCNDNDFSTEDKCLSSRCSNIKIAACKTGDNYCAENCNSKNDKDCKQACNSDIDCNDNEPCTNDACKEGICENTGIGCYLKKTCVPYGYRKYFEYCDIDESMKDQKEKTEACSNNYECASNVCIDSKCVPENVFKRFLIWFRSVY